MYTVYMLTCLPINIYNCAFNGFFQYLFFPHTHTHILPHSTIVVRSCLQFQKPSPVIAINYAVCECVQTWICIINWFWHHKHIKSNILERNGCVDSVRWTHCAFTFILLQCVWCAFLQIGQQQQQQQQHHNSLNEKHVLLMISKLNERTKRKNRNLLKKERNSTLVKWNKILCCVVLLFSS